MPLRCRPRVPANRHAAVPCSIPASNVLTRLCPRALACLCSARFALLCQLVTVMPVILFIIRTTVFGFIMDTEYPGFFLVFGLNLLITTVTTLISIFYPMVGDVLRFTGAGCGFVYIFFLPVCVHLLRARAHPSPSGGTQDDAVRRTRCVARVRARCAASLNVW